MVLHLIKCHMMRYDVTRTLAISRSPAVPAMCSFDVMCFRLAPAHTRARPGHALDERSDSRSPRSTLHDVGPCLRRFKRGYYYLLAKSALGALMKLDSSSVSRAYAVTENPATTRVEE